MAQDQISIELDALKTFIQGLQLQKNALDPAVKAVNGVSTLLTKDFTNSPEFGTGFPEAATLKTQFGARHQAVCQSVNNCSAALGVIMNACDTIRSNHAATSDSLLTAAARIAPDEVRAAFQSAVSGPTPQNASSAASPSPQG